MPSFDVVSDVDEQELRNAVDQANREFGNRFDFKGTDSKVEQNGLELTLYTDSDFRIKQMQSVLHEKMSKRSIDIACLEKGDIETSMNSAKQKMTVKSGIDKDTAKKIVKLIKDSKMKVQAAIQGEQVRITGKKRDDLQSVIAMLKDAGLGIPLQFNNFRD